MSRRYPKIIKETARKHFVEAGQELHEIYDILGPEPGYRTLERWCNEEDWPSQRVAFQTQFGNIATIRATLGRIIKNADEELDPVKRNKILMSAQRCMFVIERMETGVDKERAVLVGGKSIVDYCQLHGDRQLAEDISDVIEPAAKWIKETGGVS